MKSNELLKIVNQVKSDMDSIGIPYDPKVPVVINNRLTRCLGMCRYRYGKAYVIELSNTIIASDIQELKNTICHELIHSATPGHHHGGKWKVYANKMTKSSNYTITRLHDTESLNQEAMIKNYKYKVVCSGCGSVSYYTRKTKFTNTLQNNNGDGNPWYCSKCHGHHWDLIEL